MAHTDKHNLTCSATASEVTTLWRYRDVCIIIIIIISRYYHTCSVCYALWSWEIHQFRQDSWNYEPPFMCKHNI